MASSILSRDRIKYTDYLGSSQQGENCFLNQPVLYKPLTSQQSAQLRTAEKQINKTRIELLAATDRKLEAKEILDKIETAEALTGKQIRTGGNKRVKR